MNSYILKLFKVIKDNITLSLAIATIYLYWCTFDFEAGFLENFDIDDSYVSIDFNIMLLDAERLIIIILGVVIIYSLSNYLLMKVVFKKLLLKKQELKSIFKMFSRLLASILFIYDAVSIPTGWIKYYAIAISLLFLILMLWLFIPLS